MLPPYWKTALATALFASAFSQPGLAQVPPPTILQVDVENLVAYSEDTSDLSKFATNPNATPAVLPKNFNFRVDIGDIVAVNGQPAKGTLIRNNRQVLPNTAPNPGQSIADTVRGAVHLDSFEILKTDGTPIGTIVSYGLGLGSPAPGAPLSITQANLAIIGGTGAFLGARGQWGQALTPQTIAVRQASVTEDPANRRRNEGGRVRFVLQIIPLSQPQIVTTPGGPAVTHCTDFTLVTGAKPAAVGENLCLFATGLGPTRPGVDPGQPFPSSPPAVVNSPVQVTVNGNNAQVIGAVGYPGTLDGYQVNFQVPAGTAKGPASVQVSAAWIAGPAVNIPIQ